MLRHQQPPIPLKDPPDGSDVGCRPHLEQDIDNGLGNQSTSLLLCVESSSRCFVFEVVESCRCFAALLSGWLWLMV
jgi:hypothetical protein